MYRSIDGYPVESYSRDGGRTWSTPRYKRFADGRRMKHPRAANFAWKCTNGKYLYWFHNHGGKVMREAPGNADGGAYDDRNPVWLSAGIEIDTPAGREIAWSEPEIALYDSDPYVRISYPDLVEEGGRYYLTETQKDIARVHEIPAELLEGMWTALAVQLGQGEGPPANNDKLLLSLPTQGTPMPAVAPLPPLPWFRVRDWSVLDFRGKDTGGGVALELELTLPALAPGHNLLDNRDAAGRGFCLRNNVFLAEGGIRFPQIEEDKFTAYRGQIAAVNELLDTDRKTIGATVWQHDEAPSSSWPWRCRSGRVTLMKTSDIHIRDPFILPLPDEGRYLLFGTTGKNAWSGPGLGFDCGRKKWLYTAEPGSRIPANLYRPKQVTLSQVGRLVTTSAPTANIAPTGPTSACVRSVTGPIICGWAWSTRPC